jgi:hypothetical protein
MERVKVLYKTGSGAEDYQISAPYAIGPPPATGYWTAVAASTAITPSDYLGFVGDQWETDKFVCNSAGIYTITGL